MAVIYDLYVEQGSTFYQTFDLSTDNTGDTIRCTIVDGVGTSVTPSIVWTDDTTGQFSITITGALSASMSNGIGKYDIEVENSSGVIIKPIKGRVYIEKEVTV